LSRRANKGRVLQDARIDKIGQTGIHVFTVAKKAPRYIKGLKMLLTGQ